MANKNGQNEGNIRQRKDGRWEGRVSLGWKDGKRFRPSFYADTRKEVADAIRAAIKAHSDGTPILSDKLTVKAHLETWLEESVKPKNRPRTYTSYKQMCDLHLIPHIGHFDIRKLQPQHVQTLLNAKKESGLSARTVTYARAILRRSLNQALKWQLVSRNVAALVDPPAKEAPKMKHLSEEQARNFLAATDGHALEALFSVALSAGLRLGEALGLRMQDVDFKTGTLHIRKQLQYLDTKDKPKPGEKQKKEFVLTEPKSDDSRRYVQIPEVIFGKFREHCIKQKLLIASKPNKFSKWELVFTTEDATPLDQKNVRRSFYTLLDKAKVDRIRFHDLRHTCATLLLAQGVDLRVIKDILGHTSIQLTADTYVKVVTALQKDAAAKMGAMLTTPTNTPTQTVDPNQKQTVMEN